MSKQSIVCRVGAENIAAVTVPPETQRFDLDLTHQTERFGHGIGRTLEQVLSLGITPSAVAFDLFVVAACVYRCDTRISRVQVAEDSWTREIDLHLPVHDVNLWNGIAAELSRTLGFLTGDRWRFLFRPLPDQFDFRNQEHLREVATLPRSVCLFSGGLDSYIGAVDLLHSGEHPLFVRHACPWDSATNKFQKLSLQPLADRYSMEVLKCDVGFHKNAKTDPSENTERSRSFLFFSAAALAASGLGQPEALIHVPENGLMSLNVPLDPLRLGSLSTRTTHPFFMGRFNDILTSLQIPARVANRYRFKTKGQMVGECGDRDFLIQQVSATMSCASPKKYRTNGVPYGHCGHCYPCIIRRASLQGYDDQTTYVVDVRGRTLASDKAEGESVRSCQIANGRLNHDLRRARIVIHKPGPLGENPADLEAWANVYLQGMEEIERFLSTTRTSPSKVPRKKSGTA